MTNTCRSESNEHFSSRLDVGLLSARTTNAEAYFSGTWHIHGLKVPITDSCSSLDIPQTLTSTKLFSTDLGKGPTLKLYSRQLCHQSGSVTAPHLTSKAFNSYCALHNALTRRTFT